MYESKTVQKFKCFQELPGKVADAFDWERMVFLPL